MSDQTDDKSLMFGRGRGRGLNAGRLDPEPRATSSSTSEKRPNGNGNGNGKANGNGQKRGMTRDSRATGIFKTKPENITKKQGTTGPTVKLSANFFKFERKPSFEFQLYRADFEPETDNIFLRKRIVAEQKETLGGYLFDGQNMIYLTRRLPLERNTFPPFISREGTQYLLTIKNTNQTIEITDGNFLQVLNLILRRAMDGLKMQLVGRNLYDAKSRVKMDQYRLELWPGYITSVRQHETDILVCCEVSHKVMREETVLDILTRIQRESRGDYREEFKKEIIGKVVLTDYNSGGNSKTYRVDDVDFGSSPETTFDMKGTPTSYKDYYFNRYNLKIKEPKQPMLISNPSARDQRAGRTQVICLVPEFCRSTGLTDSMRSNFQMMKAMAEHTQMIPEKRRARLLELSRRWHATPESVRELDSFNVDIGKQLIEFDGRALPQEEMLFGNKTCKNDNRVDWTNPLKNAHMYKSEPLKRWILIYPQRSEKETTEFHKLMEQVARGMNYEMGNPKLICLKDDRTSSYLSEINGCIAKDPKMIMIVVPNNAADRYAAIKKATCVNQSIPTQVIVHKTMCPKKGNMAGVMSIATKVMIQINSKLGGAPWMVNFPMKGVMTIGFDVTHDTSDRSKSFGAFVASMDLKTNVRYYSAVASHTAGNEISQTIETFTVNALKAYKNLHGGLPERIFFYRDGVGDGDIQIVCEMEVQRLKAKLSQIYEKMTGSNNVKLTFIIVNKRINTRIFENDRQNKVKNPESGTVVDDVITLPERYDFFLVSQSVRQGTVAPTSYNVIYDTNGLSADRLQLLTYKNCHLYYNWSGTTRVPAVVQYAHKLAFLVGQYLHQPPSSGFDNTLYFL